LQGYQSNCIILNKIKVLNKSKVFFYSKAEAVVLLIVIKPGQGVDPARGLTRPGGRVPGFIGQLGSTRKNFKKIKVLIFHMKKLM
jgi:hypothetical protein